MSTKGQTCDECGHGVRLKVNPNVRIPGTRSEFLLYSTNKMELFEWFNFQLSRRGSDATHCHIREDITTAAYNGTTVRHVIPVEEIRTVCNQPEAYVVHTSNHTCSELRILESSGQDIWKT